MAVSGVKHHLYGKSHLCLLSFLSLGSNLCVASMSFFLYCRISSTDYTECKTLKHEHCLNNQVLKHTLRNTKGWLVILGWLKHVTLSCALWCIGIKANRPCANRIYLISSLISFTSVTWAFFLFFFSPLRNMAALNESQDSQIFLQNICHMTTSDQSH